MQIDVTELKQFYATPLGQVVRRLLSHRIRARWRGASLGTVMGLGFASPFLGAFRRDAVRLAALMPAGQGALVWPSAGPVRTVLVEEDRLPLADNSVDRLLLVHALEVAERPGALLRELWRVLTPEGRLLMIVPNRRGIWARTDATPFGQGRPYSRGQLELLLKGALFTPSDWGSALHFPPLGNRIMLRSALAIERLPGRYGTPFAGVIIVEARKELTAPIGKPAAARAIRDVVAAR
ncbi:MAG: class I SAM-dependent methyltransferase [Hyphomicrobium sp.]